MLAQSTGKIHLLLESGISQNIQCTFVQQRRISCLNRSTITKWLCCILVRLNYWNADASGQNIALTFNLETRSPHVIGSLRPSWHREKQIRLLRRELWGLQSRFRGGVSSTSALWSGVATATSVCGSCAGPSWTMLFFYRFSVESFTFAFEISYSFLYNFFPTVKTIEFSKSLLKKCRIFCWKYCWKKL